LIENINSALHFLKSKQIETKTRRMETKMNQNQIIIKMNTENEKKMLPMNLILTLAAGTIAGMAVIFTLFWGVEKLLGM
jgi:hypothetical protein